MNQNIKEITYQNLFLIDLDFASFTANIKKWILPDLYLLEQKEVIIPSKIEYQNQFFFVDKINSKAFFQQYDIYIIKFENDCKIRTIEPFAFEQTSITEFSILPSFGTIEGFNIGMKLKEVKMINSNPHFCILDNKVILSKSLNSIVYDTILFVPSALTSLSVPGDIKRVGLGSFWNCPRLESITFSSKSDGSSDLEEICDYSFCFCLKLITITIPDCNHHFAILENGLLVTKNEHGIIDDCTIIFAPRNIQTTEIPGYVKKIGIRAFYHCEQLKSITFLSNSDNSTKLEEISDYAFSYCRALKSISIPGSLKKIGEYAFQFCDNLEKIEILPNASGVSFLEDISNTFISCNRNIFSFLIPSNNPKFSILQDGLVVARNLNDCTLIFAPRNLKNIRVPSFVKKIGINAFTDCAFSEIQFLTNEDGTLELEEICDFAFHSCYKLSSIKIPSSVIRIGKKSFFVCCSLLTYELLCDNNGEYHIKEIDESAFESCARLKTALIPPTIKRVSPRTFYQSGIQNVIFLTKSDGTTEVEEIADKAFLINAIASISIPSSVRKIGINAFYQNVNLQHIKFLTDCNHETKLEVIGSNAFENCWELKEISIPASVKRIEDGAFHGCARLQAVRFLYDKRGISNLQYIGDRVFNTCYSLPSLCFPNAVQFIGIGNFENADVLKCVYLPSREYLEKSCENSRSAQPIIFVPFES